MPFFPSTKKNPYNARVESQKFKATLLEETMGLNDEIAFNLNNDAHLAKVRDCTDVLNTYLPILQSHDRHIATGFGIAIAALALSAVIPFGLTIAMTGVAYGAYFLGKRDVPYNQFNAALEELAQCCDWALSDVTDKSKFDNEHIKNMLNTLASFVTKDDLITIMGSADEAQKVIEALHELHEQEQNDAYQLATKESVNYHLYGYQQGGSLASMANVARIYFQKAASFLWALITNAMSKTAENNAEEATGMKI